MFIERFDTIK